MQMCLIGASVPGILMEIWISRLKSLIHFWGSKNKKHTPIIAKFTFNAKLMMNEMSRLSWCYEYKSEQFC